MPRPPCRPLAADLEPDLGRSGLRQQEPVRHQLPDGPCPLAAQRLERPGPAGTRARAAAAGRSGRRRWPPRARPRRCRPAGRGACRAAGAARSSPGRPTPTSPTVSWRTSTRTARPAVQERLVVGARQELGTARPVGHLRPERLLDLERPLLQVHDRLPVRPGAGAATRTRRPRPPARRTRPARRRTARGSRGGRARPRP